MKAYIFSGQGSQKPGMAKDLLLDGDASTKEYLQMADDILGYKLSEVMTDGSAADLKQTQYTQPAVFVYGVIKCRTSRNFKPDMVAGHSLGEFVALAATRAISYADGLRLVHKRALAMQKACDAQPSGMGAVLGLDDSIIESICAGIEEEIVVPANYNCPGQLVISGTDEGLRIATDLLKEAGARTVLRLNVNGAFHSPLMQSASDELASAIEQTEFKMPSVPIYQNVTARPTQDPDEIKENLIKHLTSPVRWTETIENMLLDEARYFIEVGTRPVLSSMIKRIDRKINPLVMQ